MPNINSNLSIAALAGVVAVCSIAAGTLFHSGDAERPETAVLSVPAAHADDPKGPQRWAASATGRIEPSSGLINIVAEVGGQIEDILVGTNDKVRAGDLLIVLDDEDYEERVAAASAEVDVREREREEETATGVAKERQDAEDAVAAAERDLFAAWRAFDAAFVAARDGSGSSSAVSQAREEISKVEKRLETARAELAAVNAKDDLPLLTRLESSLSIARSELAVAERAFERTRVRAPFDGTVLNVYSNTGDTVAPSAGRPLLAFGDVSRLKVRAEVEERDIAKVRTGQKVVVRSDAFPGQEFTGTVSEIASALGAPRIATRGPRRPNDVDVLEVVASIDGMPPLLAGMRVDVFFKHLNGEAKADAEE